MTILHADESMTLFTYEGVAQSAMRAMLEYKRSRARRYSEFKGTRAGSPAL